MRNLISDKRGEDERVFSLWWFFILTIIGVGIVVSVLLFYSADEDVRGLESELLYQRTFDCIIDNGFLIQGISNKNFDLIKTCNLNEKIINVDKLYYINIGIFDKNGNLLREDGKNIEEGNKEFLMQCQIQEPNENGKIVEAKHYAKCFKKTIYINYNGGKIKKAKLEILTASNNLGRKISFTEND